MADNPKRWIVKDSEGLLKGPFSTEEILERISSGAISGDEMISIYPGANWYPISQDEHFYDRLLEVLSGHANDSRVIDDLPSPVEDQPALSSSFAATEEDDEEEFVTSRPKALPEDTPRPEFSSEEPPAHEQTKTTVDSELLQSKKKKSSSKPHLEDIEMVDVQKKIRQELKRRAWLPLVAVGVILAGGLYLLFSPDEIPEERIHLLIPQTNRALMSGEQAKAKFQKGVAEYVRDTFSGYMRAQNEFVQGVEGAPRSPEFYGQLCLTYFELWPYAFQDSSDLKAVNVATQVVSALDKTGPHAATCKAVDLLLKGRYAEAKSLSSSILEAFGSSSQPPIPFYYFMAILLDAGGDAQTAVGYLSSAEQLWPNWIRAFVYQAQLYAKIENFSEAARIYRLVLQANPQHDVAKIELGILEYKYFRNLEKGSELIQSAVNSTDRVPRRILSKGYFGLSEIALQKHDSSTALKFARKSYALDSTNSSAKNLMVQLGGSKEISGTQFKAYQLIAEGDQFFREGDCNSAQAHYKAAFEGDPKSAVAAMKAGECLWRLSLSTEAIEWLNKAIRSDPNLIEAYVTLADYYSQRFNFVAAAQVLLSAQRAAPKSYEVFRGYALVEFRRKNLKAAVENAKQALSIYDTDVDSHVIMAESLLGLGDFRNAYAHASRAIEIDVNHRKAQVIYGRTLGGVQGSAAAVSFLSELVKKYPLVTEYRLALAKQLLDDERMTEAERVLNELLQIDDKSKEAFLLLGRTQQLMGKYDSALETLLRAAVLDPADAEPLFQAGLLYLEAKKPTEAKSQFQRVLKINKFYPLVHFQLGRTALVLQDAREALNEAKEERNVNPNLAEAYLLAAEAYSLQQQYTLCVSEYQKAVKLRPQSAEIYLKMAQCYRKADNLEVAIAMLNQAAEKESGMPDIYRELGMIYEQKGDVTNAVAAYRQYFVLNPNAADRAVIENRVMSLGRGR